MKPRRILLVDDDRDDRAMAVLLLRREPGLEVDEVADGVTFAERLARGEFALAIAGHRLGWGDGLRVLEAVKALYPDRPTLLLAADLEPELVSKSIGSGLDALLPKTTAGYLRLAETVAGLLSRRAGGEDLSRRRLIENLPVGVFTVSAEAGITRANQALAAILGADAPAELWGEPLDGYLAEPGAQMRCRQALERGEKLRGLEARIARRDGAAAWARLSAWPVSGGDGEPRVLDGTLEDITAHKRAEQELSRRAEDLDRINAELRDFAHVVSHDLQAPLARIEGYARLLADHLGPKLDDTGRGHLERLAAATERLHGMLAAILEYSRVESRGGERGPVDMGSVLDEVVETLRPAIEESGGTVTNDPLPEVIADRAQMVLLLQNLVGNAIKFRRDAPPAVHVSAARNERGWDVTVADNGIGMSAEDSRRIFGMFERLHAESEVPGSGVGLAICKRIVVRHGGAIRVESEPGRGSRFTVHLPDPPIETRGDRRPARADT